MNRYRTRNRQVSTGSSASSSNRTNSHSDQVDHNLQDNPREDPEVNNLVNNMENLNIPVDQGAAGAEAPPPPYPGPANNGPNAAELLGLVQNLIQAQQQQHQNQVDSDTRFQNAHRELGVQIENLTRAMEHLNGAGAGGARPHHGGAQSFKPSMFRALDMKATNKENKLLSEEFVNWTLSIKRVLQANPGVAALPIQRLTALILAGIGEKAERRLTGLGQNPTFHSLEEFFDRLKSIFCSSTVQTDAEEQFHSSKQYAQEDLNSWHARCLLYFRLAFPHQEYWNLVLKKFFEGMTNKKLSQKTLEVYIVTRPGGWEALCNENGYDHCLQLTLKCQAQEAFINNLFADNSRNTHKASERSNAPVPMDTSAVQSRNYPRNRGAIPRNSTANVNQNVRPGGQSPKPNPTSGQAQQGSNPPGGMQKKLNDFARSQGGQSKSKEGYKPRDKSKDTCKRCNQLGHWAKECTQGTQVSAERKTWGDINIVSSVPTSMGVVFPPLPIKDQTNPN